MERWLYNWLYSCPYVLTLGSFRIGDLKGYVLMPVLNYRVNLLGEDEKIRIIANIPDTFGGEVFRQICLDISRGLLDNLEPFKQAIALSMFHGGYNLVIIYKNRAYPLTIDLINTDKYRFYIKPGSSRDVGKHGLETWMLLGLALRTGEADLLAKACVELGSWMEEKCLLPSINGDVVISIHKLVDRNYIELIPDNNPLRHVVRID